MGRKSTLEGIGLAKRSAVSYAALANGIGIHADDYDDTQLSSAPDRVYGLLTHPTAPVLSSALAVAESRGLSGRELIVAYHPGVEVECKIAEAINPRHYEDGFHSTEGGGYDAGALTFGKPWTFLSPGISIKPFPSGSLTHPGMTALLKLIREHDVKPGQVERLDVSTNRNMPNALIHHKPADSLQAKFSMEFCMSSLLLYRRAGLNEFTDETVRRPEVQAMIARVQFVVSDIAEKAGYDKMTTILDLHLHDGRTISGRADFAKGSPADPMSWSEVVDKLEDCARFAKWPSGKAKSIVSAVAGLQDLSNITELTRYW